LEPANLGNAYVIRPEHKAGDADDEWHGKKKWCKEWNKAHSDKVVITKEKSDRIPRIVARLKELPEFFSALENGHREVSFFKRDPETDLLLKCRTDLIAKDFYGDLWIFDMKKVQTGQAGEEAFGKSAFDYGYHIQAAAYLKLTGAKHFVLVPFDDAEPFDACQHELTDEMLDWGAKEYRRILLAYAKCVSENRWPGYKSGINKLKLPPYAISQMNRTQHAAWLSRIQEAA
jgi:hypothetical protein